MITGAHVLIYSTDAEADRAFLRETFALEAVDAGDGWLIFALPPAELAVHPTASRFVLGDGTVDLLGCVLYLMCDDVVAEIERLGRRGVSCSPTREAGWGAVTTVPLPSGAHVGLYQPRHVSPIPR